MNAATLECMRVGDLPGPGGDGWGARAACGGEHRAAVGRGSAEHCPCAWSDEWEFSPSALNTGAPGPTLCLRACGGG